MKRINIFSFILIITIGVFLAGCASNTGDESEKEVSEPSSQGNDSAGEEKPKNDQFYFTANEGGSISKIDSLTNEVVKTIEVDGVVHNVQVSPDGKILGATVVPMMGSHTENSDGSSHEAHGETTNTDNAHEDSHGNTTNETDEHGQGMAMGKALFFDVDSDKLLYTVEVGNHPAHIVFTNNGNYALVTNNEDDTVSVISMNTYKVTNVIETGAGPHGFRISPDGLTAYIANMNENTVSVINLDNMKEEKKITVGSTPVTTAITNNGKTLVATLNSDNLLAIVDLTTEEVQTVEVGVGPAQVYIDGNNQYAYVANQGTIENPSHSVTVVDLTTNQVITTVETGDGSHGVVVSSDNKYLYVTNMFENTVSVIDTKQFKVVEEVKVGQIPNGISINN